jgi:dihydroorotate dehydrogenase
MGPITALGQRALFCLDPETAHGLSIQALKLGLVPGFDTTSHKRLGQTIAGLDFPNPVGLAAGYDKNGEVPDAILRLGFGFTEIGTLTPRPQSGNPKPRIFRLARDKGIINRLGFNNEGHEAALARLNARAGKPGLVGVNIGANKDSEDFIADYELGIITFAPVADYFTVNISSPNTPGLRNLQAGDALEKLLDRVFNAREKSSRHPPVFLKLAPDLSDVEVRAIAKVIAASSLDGVMISNTTLSRAGIVESATAREAGGLSGAPLFLRSTIMLARFRQQLPKTLPLIGIGGIGNAENAWDKLEAGASLIQLYSCMVYEGPMIARKICKGIAAKMDKENLSDLSQVTGRRSSDWANRELVE